MPVLMELLSGAIAARYKVLRPNVASGVDSARFLGEIQTAARLHHSPILPLIIRTRPTVDLLRIEWLLAVRRVSGEWVLARPSAHYILINSTLLIGVACLGLAAPLLR